MAEPQPDKQPATIDQPSQPQDEQTFLWPFSDLANESDQSEDSDKAHVEHIEDAAEPRQFQCQLCETVLRGTAWRQEDSPWVRAASLPPLRPTPQGSNKAASRPTQYLCDKCFEPEKGIGSFQKAMFYACGECRAPPRGSMLLAKCGECISLAIPSCALRASPAFLED